MEAAIEAEPEGASLFHVTTNLPAVLADDRLRSRRELRTGGLRAVGLGGGPLNEADNKVSVGILKSGALRLYRGVRMMALAVHGRIQPADALAEMTELSSGALDMIDHAIDGLDRPDPLIDNYESELVLLEQDVLRAPPGPNLYDALRRYEQHIATTVWNWSDLALIPDEEEICSGVMGFLEPSHMFERVRVEDIAVVVLAGREGAEVELVPRECELRFRSGDLALVGTLGADGP
jgi:hypothetical protein